MEGRLLSQEKYPQAEGMLLPPPNGLKGGVSGHPNLPITQINFVPS